MKLDEIRSEIDRVDDELLQAFCRRMDLVGQVADTKKSEGMGVRHRDRERAILSRIGKEAGDYSGYARVLFSTLFDLSCSYQAQRMGGHGPLAQKIEAALNESPALFPKDGVVACQGAEGAYSGQACERLLPHADILYFHRFENVFDAVDSGLCQYGILPIDNSSNGSVSAVYELMKSKHFHIIRSTRLCVHHQLLARPGVKLSDIREITSHEQAIGQCSTFLETLPQATVTPAANTALAAKAVAESGRNDLAAIASPACAALYGLKPVADDIQNSQNNYTRFICITKDLRIYQGANRISLMLSAPHRPGGLYELIAKFAALGLNLTKLESRPMVGRDFEFLFYFDLEASALSPEVLNLLDELSQSCEIFEFLGNYSDV